MALPFPLLSLLLLLLLPLCLILPLLAPPWPLSPKAQGCRMSWMSPSYHLIPGVNVSHHPQLEGRYRLWLYREVGWDADDSPSGQPVLFLPGNSGSFKQSRSLASSASRQYFSSPFLRSPAFPGHTKPLDVFSLDTSEELSAFSSSPLLAQAEYAAAAISHILSLYPSPAPTEVLLIAHSMGGLVARLLLTHHPQAKVRNIIALSTPHAFPPLPISRELERVYAPHPQELPEGVMLLTVCGGAQDTEFPAELCGAWPPGSPTSPQEETSLTLTRWTSSTPHLWTGIGHREIVWCHQLRFLVARLALDLQGLHSLGERKELVQRVFEFDLPEPAFDSAVQAPEPELGRAGASQGLWALLHPLTNRVTPFLCTPSSCTRAKVLSRKLLPHPPAGEVWPRPGEGVGEREGVVYSEFEFRMEEGEGWVQLLDAQGKSASERKEQGQGGTESKGQGAWSALGRVREVTSDVGLFGALRGITVPLPQSPEQVLHTRVSFPRLRTHALLVYRASVRMVGECDLFPPLLASSPSAGAGSEEAHYHPRAHASPGYFTTHTSGPFLPSRPSALQLDIYAASSSSSQCTIPALHVHLDIWASLSRVLPRYRILLIAWSAGISALLSLLSLRAWDTGAAFPTVPAAFSFYIQRVFPWLSLALWGLALLPLPEGLVIGTAGLPVLSPLAPMLLAGATVLVGLSWGLLWALTRALAWLMQLVRIRPSGGGTARPRGVRHYLPLALSSLLLVIFVPSQFVFLVAFLLQLYTASRAEQALHSTSSRQLTHLPKLQAHAAQAQHLLLMLLCLLPLTAPFAAVWARTLPSRGLEPVLSSERDPLAVVCAVLAIESASAGRVWDRARGPAQRWGTAALLAALTGYCFVCGARYTYGIYEAVELYFLASLLRPTAGNGDCQTIPSAKEVEAK